MYAKESQIGQTLRCPDCFTQVEVKAPKVGPPPAKKKTLDELEERIRSRGADDEARIARRLATALEEMNRAGEFEHLIINKPGRLAAAVDDLSAILTSARQP